MLPASYKIPTDNLQLNDLVGLFQGPQRGSNYAGKQTPLIKVTLSGSVTVRVETNSTSLLVNSIDTPNPNSWTALREVRHIGLSEIPLFVLDSPNWVRVSILSKGSGSCTMELVWQEPGDLVDPLIYLGLWNADSNSPTLSDGVGTRGGYYLVCPEGTSTVDGISDWTFGDRIAFNGTAWVKLTDDLLS